MNQFAIVCPVLRLRPTRLCLEIQTTATPNQSKLLLRKSERIALYCVLIAVVIHCRGRLLPTKPLSTVADMTSVYSSIVSAAFLSWLMIL